MNEGGGGGGVTELGSAGGLEVTVRTVSSRLWAFSPNSV